MLLESAVKGVMPIYIESMSGGVIDYYGFTKNKVVINVKKIEDISRYHISFIKKYSPKAEAIKYYNNTYNTALFGKEAEKVVELIERYLDGYTDKLCEFKV